MYPLKSPLRDGGVFTISVGRVCGSIGLPQRPQKASCLPTSLPQLGHFIRTSSPRLLSLLDTFCQCLL